MVFLNTYWTWSYFAMLLFVFWTLWLLSGKMASYGRDIWGNRGITAGRLLWAALGTFFFHCIW